MAVLLFVSPSWSRHGLRFLNRTIGIAAQADAQMCEQGSPFLPRRREARAFPAEVAMVLRFGNAAKQKPGSFHWFNETVR